MEQKSQRTNSFVGHFVVQLSSSQEASNLKKMKDALLKICQRVNLKPTGRLSELKVDSPIKDCPAIGLVQQLLTSAIAIDGWPEHSRLIVLLHSCQNFDPNDVTAVLKKVYPKANILSNRFADWSYG